MNLYENWLPDHAYYAFHLLAWIGLVVALQWAGFHQLLWRNRRAVFGPSFLLGSYLILTDIVAVHLNIWYFDPQLILAGAMTAPLTVFLFKPFGVPIEEWLFFYLTALLVAQSFIMFLPASLRTKQN